MARIFIDGFESGGYDLYDTSHANTAVISSAGLDMDGDYCLDLTADLAYVQKTITAGDEVYVAFQWRPTAPATHQPIFLLYSGATYLAALFRNNVDNNLDAYRGTTVIDSGSKVIANATTYLIEVYFKLADAGGRFVVKVDGVTDIDFTGDTKDGANATFDGLRLGHYTSSFYAKAYFDTFVIDDSAWIGESFIQGLVPTGIGNSSAWTPSAGNNYACVDEIPANDADSVLSQAADETDTYTTEDIAGSAEIKCVQIQSRCKVTAGVSKNIKLVVRVNATDYLSGDKTVATVVKSLFNLWENNPDDAAAWEKADVNGMEIGVKSGATANSITAYQTLAQVEWIHPSLNANDVECLTEVTAAYLELDKLWPEDVSCSTQITVPSFSVKREISIPNIESSPEVTAGDLTIPYVYLGASDVSCLTENTAPSIYKELFPQDIECLSSVDGASAEWIMIGRMNVTLPMITAEMSGGHGGFLNVELPMITAAMRAGARLNVTLPMITAELEGKVGVKADLNVTLPMITAEMTGTVEVLGQLNVTLPMITARMTGTAGHVGQLNVTLPMITAALTGYTDIDGQLNVTLPMIEARLVGTVERDACPVLRYEEPELE